MDVLDGLEPRHALVVDVMCFVVENGQFLDLADDLSKVGVGGGGFSDRLRPEGLIEEIAPQIIILELRLADISEIDTMDIGQEEIPNRTDDPDIILNV